MTQIEMNDAARHAAKGIAVSYCGYNEARASRNPISIIAWGQCLLADQELTGIEMYPAHLIAYFINHAKAQMAEAEAQELTA